MTVGERWQAIQEAIARLGIAAPTIEVVGVTKFQPPALVAEAVAAGVRHLGNNYAQEGEALRATLVGAKVQWHFIGHVQSRKAKFLPAYDWLQSLDRVEIARALQARWVAGSPPLSVLVELNLGMEAQKSGVAATELEAFLEALREFPCLKVRGLMAMPPPLEPVEARRPFFEQLRRTFDRHSASEKWDTLSAGTSDDYLIALSEGATMVRLGTTLFGPRPPDAPFL